MFLTAEKAEVLKDLQSQINMCDEKIEKLEASIHLILFLPPYIFFHG